MATKQSMASFVQTTRFEQTRENKKYLKLEFGGLCDGYGGVAMPSLTLNTWNKKLP